MKNKIAIVIAYFGKLPEYNELFIRSCFDQSFDLLFFTDQKLDSKKNIKVYQMSFSDFKAIIQKKFEFPVKLNKPFKFVDFRPAIGYIFEDYLEGYDFWGHCDNDQIFGKFSHFITDEILNSYDKLYQNGHLTLYRNSYNNNRIFFKNEGMNYKEAFTKDYNFVFDEIEGIQKKYELLGIPTYQKNNFFDLSFKYYSLKRVYKGSDLKSINSEYQVFYYENGCIYRVFINSNDDIEVEEGLYLHFQKRKPKIEIEDSKKGYFILPDSIRTKNYFGLPSKEDIKKYSQKNILKEISTKLHFQKFIWNRRINKYVFKK
ncbi:DUF6625 family protein [Enterococcus avium]|uniref:DUF6625 family protein n=1 Tax=Enterococcus avium TaxID=33945 RepID=UPI0035CC4984